MQDVLHGKKEFVVVSECKDIRFECYNFII